MRLAQHLEYQRMNLILTQYKWVGTLPSHSACSINYSCFGTTHQYSMVSKQLCSYKFIIKKVSPTSRSWWGSNLTGNYMRCLCYTKNDTASTQWHTAMLQFCIHRVHFTTIWIAPHNKSILKMFTAITVANITWTVSCHTAIKTANTNEQADIQQLSKYDTGSYGCPLKYLHLPKIQQLNNMNKWSEGWDG